jgi:hypothetical protein
VPSRPTQLASGRKIAKAKSTNFFNNCLRLRATPEPFHVQAFVSELSGLFGYGMNNGRQHVAGANVDGNRHEPAYVLRVSTRISPRWALPSVSVAIAPFTRPRSIR